MNRFLLFVLLGLSLAGNVWLLLAPREASAPRPHLAGAAPVMPKSPLAAATTTEGSTLPREAAAGVSAGFAARLRAARSDDELRAVIADLRGAGVPGNVIRALVSELVRERFAAREPTQPFWRRNTPTPEFVAATQALAAEKQALLENLLGPDAAPAATLTAQQRAQRYGNISDEKLNAVVRLEREYEELRAKTAADRETNFAARINSSIQQRRLLEQEKLRDLAAVLTPEELEQYEMRNSETANVFMGQIGGLELTAEEFAGLYRLQRDFNQRHPLNFSDDPDLDALAARFAAQAVANEKAREILPDSRYYKFLESTDLSFGGVARFVAGYPQLTPETGVKLHRLQSELQNAMLRASQVAKQGGKMPKVDVTPYDAKLVELLGPEAAAAYKKQGSGRMFVAAPGGG